MPRRRAQHSMVQQDLEAALQGRQASIQVDVCTAAAGSSRSCPLGEFTGVPLVALSSHLVIGLLHLHRLVEARHALGRTALAHAMCGISCPLGCQAWDQAVKAACIDVATVL